MPVKIVRLGSPRAPGEGLRIGTVRRPPRGVARDRIAAHDFYDLWYPNLAPSEALLKEGRAASDDSSWKRFARRYATEMKTPERRHDIALLAAMSQVADFSVGCYCEDPARCHRTLLAGLLRDAGAEIVNEEIR